MEEKPGMIKLKPGIYRHFKGNEYRLLYTARHSETLEDMVVYQALYGERGVWVRPAAMWSEEVERDGYRGPPLSVGAGGRIVKTATAAFFAVAVPVFAFML